MNDAYYSSGLDLPVDDPSLSGAEACISIRSEEKFAPGNGVANEMLGDRDGEGKASFANLLGVGISGDTEAAEDLNGHVCNW